MSYWVIGLWAAAIHLVTNRDVFWQGSSDVSVLPSYRDYLWCVLGYLLVDALWGVIDLAGVIWLKYAITYVYFALMATTVLLWFRYVIEYLGDPQVDEGRLGFFGQTVFALQIVLVVVNLFRPVMFTFDAAGVYHAELGRYFVLIAQIVVFLQSSIFSINRVRRESGAMRRRHLAIAFYGLATAFFVGAQVLFPLLPLYSLGLALGGSVLHSFILEDERDEVRQKLEWALERERAQRRVLVEARHMAYTDPLTGLGSKAAYIELVDEVDERLGEGDREPFAVAVFDLNGLKHANDTYGHAAGDALIRDAAKAIRDGFPHASVFRIGGDEFLAHLAGQAFEERAACRSAFEAMVDANAQEGAMTVAAGYADLEEGDMTCSDVFARADADMYRRKRELEDSGVRLRS